MSVIGTRMWREQMGLRVRRRSPALGYIVGIIVAMAAFVSQPIFSLISVQVAGATPVPLSAPQLVSPSNNAVVNGATLTNQWQPVVNATQYVYESYNDAAATSVRYTATYTSTSKVATNVANGTVFWWRVKAEDSTGATSAWSELWKVTIDNSAPSIPTNGLPNASSPISKTNDFYFTWNASTDTNPVTYLFQSSLNPATDANGVLTTGVWSSGVLATPQIHSTGAPDGTWYWQVRAVDAAGNMSAWSPVWRMTIDTHGPVVHITAPTASNVRGTVTVSGTVTDDHPDHYYLVVMDSTGKVVAGPGTVYKANVSDWVWNTTKLSDGVYTIDLEARDSLGNKDAASTEQKNVTVDNTAPVVTMPTDKPVVGSTFKLSASATDVSGVAGCEYQIFNTAGAAVLPSDGSKTSFSCDGSVSPVDVSSLASGDYAVKVWSTDTLGNTSTQSAAQQSFTVDHTAPAATINITSDANPMASTAVTLAGTVDASDLSSFKLYIDGTETADLIKNVDGTGNWSYTLSGGLTQGSHTLSVVAVDSFGNASTSTSSPTSTVSVAVSAYVPPAGRGNVTPLALQNLSDKLSQLSSPSQVVATVLATPAQSNQSDQAVLGAKTSNDGSGSNVAAAAPVVTPSENGWKLLGVAWYWWLLVMAIGVGFMWTVSVLKRRRQTA